MKPLDGLRLLHTRPVVDDDAVARALSQAGAVLLHAPVIAFAPPRDPGALARALGDADAILLTSARAVSAVARLVRRDVPAFTLAGATLQAARDAGLAVVHVEDAVDGASLGRLVAARGPVEGRRFVLPVSDAASPAAADELRARGATVEVVEAYRTVPATALPASVVEALDGRRVDAALCMSPSAVDTLVALAGIARLAPLLRASPGATTACAWERHGLPSDAVAARPEPASIVDVLVAWRRR